MRLSYALPRCIVFATAVALAACATPSDDSAADRGAALLQPFKQDLMQALLAGLEQGPDEAISVCRERAPEIAAALSVDGVAMGRTSHRLRNPANSGPAWVSPVLGAYLEEASERAPVVVSLPGDRVGYVEPIVLQPLCLTCHGATLAPEVAARIRQEYPQDRATGFEVGDLRGVFWAEFPAARRGAGRGR